MHMFCDMWEIIEIFKFCFRFKLCPDVRVFVLGYHKQSQQTRLISKPAQANVVSAYALSTVLPEDNKQVVKMVGHWPQGLKTC